MCLSADVQCDVQSPVLKSADAVIHLNSVETGFFLLLFYLKQSNAPSFTTLDLGTVELASLVGLVSSEDSVLFYCR